MVLQVSQVKDNSRKVMFSLFIPVLIFIGVGVYFVLHFESVIVKFGTLYKDLPVLFWFLSTIMILDLILLSYLIIVINKFQDTRKVNKPILLAVLFIFLLGKIATSFTYILPALQTIVTTSTTMTFAIMVITTVIYLSSFFLMLKIIAVQILSTDNISIQPSFLTAASLVFIGFSILSGFILMIPLCSGLVIFLLKNGDNNAKAIQESGDQDMTHEGDNSKEIGIYYDDTTLIWTLMTQNRIHYGIWDNNISTPEEASEYTDIVVAKHLELRSDDVVLDAGCGVGGTATFLGKKYGSEILGISISRHQIAEARKLAVELDVDNIVRFERHNYLEADLPNNAFSKIYGIESICHAPVKKEFLKEAYRLIRPGGRLVVLDGFLTKQTLTEKQDRRLRYFIEGWSIPNLANKKKFAEELEEVGFTNVEFHNYTGNIQKSVRNVYMNGLIVFPLISLMYKLGWVSDSIYSTVRSAMAQRHVLNGVFCDYGVFVASAP